MLPKYHVTSTSCQLAALVVVRGARDSGDPAVVLSRCSTADRGDTGRPAARSPESRAPRTTTSAASWQDVEVTWYFGNIVTSESQRPRTRPSRLAARGRLL